MLRIHITLNMLDCLDDIVELVQDLPDSQKRGIDKVQLQLLSETIYEKKLDIDRIERWTNETTQNEGDNNE
tara:strand:+ start:3578 stop:3790 length:213 start_codon:yes stop_codon:yes gene_type:complete